MSKEQLSVWAIPSPKDFSGLHKSMDDFARRYNAPHFPPHVTLFVAKLQAEDISESVDYLHTLRNSISPFVLETRGVGESDFFFKPLFIQLGMTDEIVRLYEKLKGQLGRFAEKPEDVYKLNPHLSLLYSDNIYENQHRELAASYTPPKSIEFNSIGYHIIPEDKDLKDVDSWNVRIIGKSKTI